jgi:hypothetical protein
MKQLLIFTWRVWAILVFIALPVSISHGQSEAEAGDGLMMVHQTDSSKSVVINRGVQIKVWSSDGSSRKGELTSVQDSSLTIGLETVQFSKATKVKYVKGQGSRLGGVLGLVLGIFTGLMGLLFGLLGNMLIQNADGSAQGCGEAVMGVLLLVLGIAIGITGAIFIIVGIVAYAVGKAVGRSFDLRGKWKMRRWGK